MYVLLYPISKHGKTKMDYVGLNEEEEKNEKLSKNSSYLSLYQQVFKHPQT